VRRNVSGEDVCQQFHTVDEARARSAEIRAGIDDVGFGP
jgi:hypothetical protein